MTTGRKGLADLCGWGATLFAGSVMEVITGSTRSSVAYLIEVLVAIARELEGQLLDMSTTERAAHERAVQRLTAPSAPLPDFSSFHPRFQGGPEPTTPEGDVREAFYLSYDDASCEYLSPDDAQQRVEEGEQVVSATFVTPYPPGFPMLVPGQLFSQQILSFMRSLGTPEVHGYRPDLGYRVYVGKVLEAAARPKEAQPSLPQVRQVRGTSKESKPAPQDADA